MREEKHNTQRFMNSKSLRWGKKVGAIEKLEQSGIIGISKA